MSVCVGRGRGAVTIETRNILFFFFLKVPPMAAEGSEPPPSVPMEVQTERSEAGDNTGDDGGALSRSMTTGAGRDRVEQLSKLLKQQQEVIYW